MENERNLKQKFLRENILEKGYNIDEFISFLIKNKGIFNILLKKFRKWR